MTKFWIGFVVGIALAGLSLPAYASPRCVNADHQPVMDCPIAPSNLPGSRSPIPSPSSRYEGATWVAFGTAMDLYQKRYGHPMPYDQWKYYYGRVQGQMTQYVAQYGYDGRYERRHR